jgi:hypothetical protein
MRPKLAILAAALVAAAVVPADPAVAPAAITNLCATSCGGAWGAREHARDHAEKHGFTSVAVRECRRTAGEYGSQWYCWGTGNHGGYHEWDVYIDAYGNLDAWGEWA